MSQRISPTVIHCKMPMDCQLQRIRPKDVMKNYLLETAMHIPCPAMLLLSKLTLFTVTLAVPFQQFTLLNSLQDLNPSPPIYSK